MWILRKKGCITAKKLGSLLDCRSSYKYLPRHRDFIINYGASYLSANLNKNIITDKLKVYNILKENNILQPNIYLKNETIPDGAFPLLARKKYHSQGRDIIYIHNREQFNDLNIYFGNISWYDFLIEYINKKSEYRVHVLKNYETFVSVKFDREKYGDPIVRSKKNGWSQINYDGDFVEQLEILAEKVLDILQYDFGAVDIIRKKDKLYVLEINSAPGLENRKLQLYADFFKSKEENWSLENGTV